jgi:hypothetical protein
MLLYGALHGRDDLQTVGRRLATIGLLLFVAGFAFFELVLGISGFGLGAWGWPILLIGLGVFILVRYYLPGRSK